MCLTTVNKLIDDPQDNDWQIGYKIFICNVDNTFSSLYLYDISIDYIYNQIYKDTSDYRIKIDLSESYRTGYHIYTDLAEAIHKYDSISNLYTHKHETLKVIKVKYRKVTAIGIDYGKKCAVAREMMLIEGVNNDGDNSIINN